MKRFFLMACVAISMLGFTAKADDYYIYTVADLQALANRVNGGTDCSGDTYYLMNDLDLSGVSNWNTIGYFNGIPGGAIKDTKRPFKGTFDGQGHLIKNYTAKYDAGGATGRITVGLFGYISGATIKNLAVTGSKVYVKSNAYWVYGGAIVGYMDGGSTVTKCSSIGNTIEVVAKFGLSGRANAGGVCGSAENSTASGCIVTENTVKPDGSKASNKANISNNYSKSNVADSNNEIHSSKQALKDKVNEINRATIIYNNFGEGSKPASPYHVNENTGLNTTDTYYAYLGIGDDLAQSGSYYSKATISYNDKKIENFEYDGWYYTLYRAGATMNVTFNLNGWSEDKKNTGWYVKEVINDGELLTAEKVSETEGNSVNNGRYTRTQVYKVTVPSKKFAIQYETRNKSDEWAATNRATILYNNFGEGNAPTSPYYIDETTGAATDYIYYMYQGIDDSRALPGTVRKAATVEHGEYKMEFEKDGNTYVLYPAGYPAVTASFYTEGLSGDWSKTGFFVEKAYNKNTGEELEMGYVAGYGNDGYDKEGNATYDETKDCFMRTEEYQITMPEAPLYITYTTQTIVPTAVEDAMNDGMQVYGTRGELVANVATPTHMVVVAIDGRVVYNAIAEGETRIALPAGIYIANNHKVVVR